MSNLGRKHKKVVKNIFQYLRGTEDLQLTFGSNHSAEVEGFTDSDYVDNPDNRKSTSNYVFTYEGSGISWRSKLQDFMSLSKIEAEYIVASKATKEANWLHRLSTDFPAKSRNDHLPPTLYCDS